MSSLLALFVHTFTLAQGSERGDEDSAGGGGKQARGPHEAGIVLRCGMACCREIKCRVV